MTIVIVTGTYDAPKSDWCDITLAGQSSTNLQRLNLAHGTSFVKTYNVLLDAEYVPPNDDSHRTASYNIGIFNGSTIPNGNDLLAKGNYVHPSISVNNINGTDTPGAKAYYAGSPTSFNVPNVPGSITRNYLEVVGSVNIAALLGQTGGEADTIVIDDGACTSGTTTVADWTFETSQPSGSGTDITGISPETGSGTASSHHATSATYTSPTGNGSTHCFSGNNWVIGDYYQFQTNLSTYANRTRVDFLCSMTRSATGGPSFKIQYSTDGTNFLDGSSFNVLVNGAAPNATWTSGTHVAAYDSTFDLGTGLLGASTAYIRVTCTANGSGSGGTVRIDDVIVNVVCA